MALNVFRKVGTLNASSMFFKVFCVFRPEISSRKRGKKFSAVIPGARHIAVLASLGLAFSSAKAEFVPEVVSIDLHGKHVPDPEFDSEGHHIAWQDDQDLWVAEIDPATGDISMENAERIATDCARMFPIEGSKTHGNGPEWLYSMEGSKIFYTVDDFHGNDWAVGCAEKVGEDWSAGVAAGFSEDVGGIPECSRVSGDTDPFFYFYASSTKKRKGVHLRRLNDPDFGWEIPFETKSPPRFSLNGHDLITAAKVGRTIQAMLVHSETQTVEQLTFDRKFHKDELFTWNAPEFGGDAVFLAAECKRPGGDASQLSIYRKSGNEWVRTKTILPPAGRKFKKLHSPEPLVFKGKSYVVVSMTTKRGRREGTEIWIAGIGAEDFYRRIAGPEHGIGSSDPEAYIANDTVYIYLAQRGGQELYRAATGL
jgi:hypothetical protein